MTDKDMIHASIFALNVVVNGMRSNYMAGMHPLSRVAITEELIRSLFDQCVDDDYLTRMVNQFLVFNKK